MTIFEQCAEILTLLFGAGLGLLVLSVGIVGVLFLIENLKRFKKEIR